MRGDRFLKSPTLTPTSNDAVVGGPTYVVDRRDFARFAEAERETTRGLMGKVAVVAVASGVLGFLLHDRIKGTNVFRGARKDARKAKTIARREYGRLASKFGG